MSNGAVLHVLRSTLFNLSHELKGEDAQEFWKLLQEVVNARPLLDPEMRASQYAKDAVMQILGDTGSSLFDPSTPGTSTHFLDNSLMDHLFDPPPILCRVCKQPVERHSK